MSWLLSLYVYCGGMLTFSSNTHFQISFHSGRTFQLMTSDSPLLCVLCCVGMLCDMESSAGAEHKSLTQFSVRVDILRHI